MFKELTKDDYLKRIEIDPSLVVPFKNVLKRIDKYFEEHGYTECRDYKKLFEDMLLMPQEGPRVRYDPGGGYFEHGAWKRKFVFEINDEPKREGCAAFYSGNRRKKYRLETDYERIVMDKETMKYSPIDIEKVLCHEFIHFLVMAGITKDNTDVAIFNGGFVNEALTEMLASEIYPEGYVTYNPQVNMIKFANILTGNVSNFKQFLEGRVDFKGNASEPHTWDKFMEHASKFHEDNTSDDYLKAQRFLIEHCVHYRMNDKKPLKIDEYLQMCSDISNSPVEDKDWNDRYLSRVDKIYLEKVHGVAHNDIDKVAPTLLRIRELSARKKELSKPANVISQKFMGMNYEFQRNDDGTFNVFIDGKMIRENHEGFTNLSSPDFTIVMEDAVKGKITLKNNKNGAAIDVDVSKEAIQRKRDEAQRVNRELDDKMKVFKSGYLAKDLAVLSSQKYDYSKVERVSLPMLSPEEKADCAYILSLSDGSKVVLDSSGKEIELTETVQDRKISKLTGIVGKPGAYAYQLKEQGIAKNGYRGKTSEGREVLLHIDDDGEVQLSRADDTFAFAGKKTLLYGTEKQGLYNRMIPRSTPRRVNERHDGEIANIENYKIKQGQELDEKALIDMVKGLDPKKRFSAMEFIKQLSLGKDVSGHDYK